MWRSPALSTGMGMLVLVAVASSSWLLWRRRNRVAPTPETLRRALQGGPGLTLQLFASYLIALIGVWTLGNNDPIYGRFLYPSYLLLGWLVFMLYQRVRDEPPAVWAMRGVLLLFIGIQVYRTAGRLSVSF